MSAPRDEIVYPTDNNSNSNNTNSNNNYINTNRVRKQIDKLAHREANKQTRKNLRTGAISKEQENTHWEASYQYYKNHPTELNNYYTIRRKEAERGRDIQRKQQLKTTTRHSIREAKRIKKETKNNKIKQLMNEYIKMAKHR